MNEHFAREIFANYGVRVIDDKHLRGDNPYLSWIKGEEKIMIDDELTSELLVALAWWMQNK